MTFPSRTMAAAVGLAALLALAPESPRAQEPAPTTPPRVVGTYRRVPPHFGKVGLTAEQREAIYKIVGEKQAAIDALEAQVLELRATMMKECEGVLTDSQRQLLEQHRASLRPTSRPAPEAPKSAG